MATVVTPITVEQFQTIQDPPGGRYELHHGELVFVPPAPNFHATLQQSLLLALHTRCGGTYFVTLEMACRPLPEYEGWLVDVGMTSRDRWFNTARRDWLKGAPDLSVEVLSPSNSRRQMQDRKETLFKGGCRQFWLVDPEKSTVDVSLPDGKTQRFGLENSLSLGEFGADSLPVAEIFRL